MGQTTLDEDQVYGRTLVTDLDRRLAHVLEPSMRRHLVRDALCEATSAQLVVVLGEVERRPPAAERMVHDRLRETIRDVLLGADPDCSLPYELRRDIYNSANETGDEVVAGLMRSLPAREVLEAPRLPRELSQIPLGRRRSLALGEDRSLLELLARDLDPVVIRHLLRNPRTQEVDVIRLAAHRPALESTLEEIFHSPRWSNRPRVRVALARNPYCAASLATRLLGSLPLPELREMKADPGLHEETRAGVERELARRAPR